MNWELIGGVAAGLASARQKAKEDEEMREYRKEASELRKMQMEDLMRRRSQKPVGGDPVKTVATSPVDDVDGETRRRFGMARGGVVGASNSEMSDWDCRCAWDGAHSEWQKQSFKK